MLTGVEPAGRPGRHVIILVHGIRTFGAWQERLAALVRSAEPGVTVLIYKYGYFGSFAFLFPFLRAIVIRRFRRFLEHNAGNWRDMRVDIVAHSFGTYITAWALRGLPLERRPRIDTVILSGSVLRQLFPWSSLDSRQRLAERVINDCGRKDVWPLVAQLFVLGAGSAGRHGFAGIIGPDAGIVNRYFPFGHSGFFETESFMESHWLPLLLSGDPCSDSETSPPVTGWTAAIEQYADPVKLLLLALPFLIALYAWQSTVAARDREIADQRMRSERDQIKMTAANAEARALAAESKAEAILARRDAAREALAREVAVLRQRREQALRLLEEASGKLYRSPLDAFLLALRAAEAGDRSAAESVRSSALRIMRIRREIAEREAQQWDLGHSWFQPAAYKGNRPVRFSPDGQLVLMTAETGTQSEGLGIDAFLMDNETQRVEKLEPPSRPPGATNRPLSFAGFISSGERVLLARAIDVEVYDRRGAFQAGFQFNGPKQNIGLMDIIDQDRMLIVGDMEGNVWGGSPLKRQVPRPIVRNWDGSQRRPLVSFQLSPSRELAAMLFIEIKKTRTGAKPPLSRFGRAYVWKVGQFDSRTQDNLVEIPVGKPVISADFQPGGTEDVLVTSDEAGVVSLWSLRGRQRPQLRQAFEHGRHPVRYIGFGAGGNTMFTIADDEVLRTWTLDGAPSAGRESISLPRGTTASKRNARPKAALTTNGR